MSKNPSVTYRFMTDIAIFLMVVGILEMLGSAFLGALISDYLLLLIGVVSGVTVVLVAFRIFRRARDL